jgi:hypothetical protein
MHMVQILLPLTRNNGQPQPSSLFGEVRGELVAQFGGLTAFTRSPAVGLWEDEGDLDRDDIVIFEVMAEQLDRQWWGDYRQRLEERFAQEVIVVRSHQIDML